MPPTTRPSVWVVVLSWNGREDTLACLRSLQGVEYANLHPLLVDNASTDDTVAVIRRAMPWVEVVVNERNLGFAAGCNVGIRRALDVGADYVLLLNNDTRVDPPFLRLLVRAAEQDPRRGPLGPCIYHLDVPTRIWSAGAYRRPFTLAWYDPHRDKQAADLPALPPVRPVDYLTGCAMLLSRAFLQEVGLFDPGFFLYYEDLDLCLRAQRRGFQPVCVPAARVWHRGSAGTGVGSPLQRYHLARSSVRFYARHTPPPLWPAIAIYRLGSTLKTVLRCLWRGEKEAGRACLRGLWDGVRETFATFQQEREKTERP